MATGEAFTLTVRAEDRFYNRATGPIPGWRVLVNGELLAEIPPGGNLVTLPNVRFDAPGVYRFAIQSLDGAVTGTANPVLVEDAPRRRIYWGDTHGHSGLAEGVGTAERFMTWARDDAGLDYVVHSEHDIWTDDLEWKLLIDNVGRFSREGEFVAFLGYEWTIQNVQGGHHKCCSARRRAPPGRGQGIRHAVGALPGLASPSRPRRRGGDPPRAPGGDYRLSDPDLERLVEIMSQHGTFEWFGRRYLARATRWASSRQATTT